MCHTERNWNTQTHLQLHRTCSNLVTVSRQEGLKAVGLLWFAAYLKSQQHASVSQWRICSDSYTFTYCHRTCRAKFLSNPVTVYWHSPSADPKTPGAWQGSHWSTNSEVTGTTLPGKRSPVKAGIKPRCAALQVDIQALGQQGCQLKVLQVAWLQSPHQSPPNIMKWHSYTKIICNRSSNIAAVAEMPETSYLQIVQNRRQTDLATFPNY